MKPFGSGRGWGLLALLLLLPSPLVAEDERPNVLFLAIDDLNDWVGCLGAHPQVKTPNIDRLAERGTLFTNAHCQAPICGPSRASLLSGLHPHVTGVYQQPTSGMNKDEKFFHRQLLPQYFRQHGYRTLGAGKITHGYSNDRAFEIYGPKGSSGPKPENGFRFHYHLPDVPYTGTQTDWGAFPENDQEMPDHKVASWAVKQLREEQESPFFLAVGFVRPHVPFYVPEKWFEDYPLDSLVLPEARIDDLEDVPETGRAIHELPKYPKLAWLQEDDDRQWKLCVQAYLACISFVDHQVGRVLDALDASPHADNTVIVLFSDHGYHLGEKDRVSKQTLWEESTRVPLIVVRPKSQASVEDARMVSRNVGLIDLYPTLLELCDLPVRKKNQGESLLRLMEDPDAEWREATLTAYPRGSYALRSDRYRYIRYEDGSEELYDHHSDPHEWTNLAGTGTSEELLESFRELLPKKEAPYHEATSPRPINAWFDTHLKEQGVTANP